MGIPTVRLQRSGLALSRLGLGLSRLHYLSERKGEALLGTAIDAGITHFDTARLYGDGQAERVLGRALRLHRGRLSVATKFGFSGSRVIEHLGPPGWSLRVLRSVGRRSGILSGPLPRFSVMDLRRSLRHSLAALKTDRVDILFLHEPPPELASVADDLLSELDRLRTDGRVGAIGVSGRGASVAAFVSRFGDAIDVRQAPEADWPPGLVPDITFGALAGGPQRFGAPGVAAGAVATRLVAALMRRPMGAVLVSTTKPRHLAELAAIAGTVAP